jgi:peptidoglycan/LPS O-acetylase OafA/YrhL
VLACSHGPLSRIRWKWLTLAGALTYPLYLVHGQVGFFLIETLQTHLQSYVVLAIATLTSFALAFLIHRFVERPAARPLRRAVDRSLESLSVR